MRDSAAWTKLGESNRHRTSGHSTSECIIHCFVGPCLQWSIPSMPDRVSDERRPTMYDRDSVMATRETKKRLASISKARLVRVDARWPALRFTYSLARTKAQARMPLLRNRCADLHFHCSDTSQCRGRFVPKTLPLLLDPPSLGRPPSIQQLRQLPPLKHLLPLNHPLLSPLKTISPAQSSTLPLPT